MGAGEFNRFDRAGDFVTGDIDVRDLFLKFTDGAGSDKARLRRNGSDLEFWDETLSAWVKLSDLVLGGLVNDLYEVQTAAAGQKVFTLTTGTYNVGQDCLQVIIDGQWLDNAHFTEDSTTQVTLNGPSDTPPLPDLVGGERVTFLVPRGRAVGGFDFDFAQGVTHNVTGTPVDMIDYTWPSGARYLLIHVSYENDNAGVGDFTIDLVSGLLYGVFHSWQDESTKDNIAEAKTGEAPLDAFIMKDGSLSTASWYMKITAYDDVIRNIVITFYAVSKADQCSAAVSIRAAY